MKLGVVGLPNVGKSTLFNAITNAGAQAENYPFCTIEPNTGVVMVPDSRLDVLAEMYHPKKVTPAVIEFVDIAGLVKGASRGEGLGNKFLSHIREVDAIVHVVRCFEDENIIHVDGSVNPARDIETINLELIFADMETLQRRKDKAEKSFRGGDKKAGAEAELAEKVTRGMTENALKGKYNGGTLPIGYIIDEDKYFQIDPLTAPIVLEAFQKYDEGMTMKEIVDYLRLKGLRTKKNGEISINSLTRMLHNRRYIGEYKFQDIVTPDVIPTIVPKDLFDRVQEKLAKNKKAPARKKAEDEYLLTTKLYCGKCGCYMVGESGTSQQKKIVHRYYKCVSVKNHKGCDKKTVKKDWIENLTLEMIKRIIFDDRMLDNLADEIIMYLGQESTLLPQLRKQLKDCEKGIDNLLNAIQMGIFTPSTKERLESLEQQKEELQIRIAQEEIIKPPIDKDKILFWLHRFRKMDTTKLEHRKRLIDSFVNAIYLYDDKIVFTFNYKDGSKAVTMEEIENSALSSDLTSLGAPF